MPYKDKEKQKAAQAASYAKRKASMLDKQRDKRRAANKKLQELKNAPCIDCKQSYPYYVMQFDHIGTDKVENVSKLVYHAGWETVLAEIAKCELVCANCHAIRTWQRTQASLV